MNCPHCNAPVDETMTYCAECGQSLQGCAQPSGGSCAQPLRENAFMTGLRAMASSKLMLAMAILFSITAAGALFGSNSATGGAISAVLVCVGIWMIYAAAKKADSPFSATGVQLVRIAAIIQFAVAVFAAVLSLAVLLIAAVALAASGPEPFDSTTLAISGAVLLGLGVVFVIVFAVMIFFAVVRWKFADSLCNSVRSGEPRFRFLTLTMVLCFVSGGLSALSIPGVGAYPRLLNMALDYSGALATVPTDEMWILQLMTRLCSGLMLFLVLQMLAVGVAVNIIWGIQLLRLRRLADGVPVISAVGAANDTAANPIAEPAPRLPAAPVDGDAQAAPEAQPPLSDSVNPDDQLPRPDYPAPPR